MMRCHKRDKSSVSLSTMSTPTATTTTARAVAVLGCVSPSSSSSADHGSVVFSTWNSGSLPAKERKEGRERENVYALCKCGASVCKLRCEQCDQMAR